MVKEIFPTFLFQQSSTLNNFSPQLIMAPAMNMSASGSQFGAQHGFARPAMIPSTGMFTGLFAFLC